MESDRKEASSFAEDIKPTILNAFSENEEEKTERSQNNDISETEMVQEEPDDTEGAGIDDPFLRSKFTWEE